VRIGDVRAGVRAYMLTSHAQLNRVYELDKAEAFGPTTKGAAHKDFAVGRLASGADMLRNLWWTAWVKSGEPGAH
jgi:hypothetical protein